MYNTKSRHLVLGAGAVQLGSIKQIDAINLAVCTEGINFLLAEIPHIKGRIELVILDENKQNVDQIINGLKNLLTEHRDDLYSKIAGIIQSFFQAFIDQTIYMKTMGGEIICNSKFVIDGMKEIYEEISQFFPKDRVSLIFQEAFNESAGALEQGINMSIHLGLLKTKSELYFDGAFPYILIDGLTN